MTSRSLRGKQPTLQGKNEELECLTIRAYRSNTHLDKEVCIVPKRLPFDIHAVLQQ